MDKSIIWEVDASFFTATYGVAHPDGFGIFLCTEGSCRLNFDDLVYALHRKKDKIPLSCREAAVASNSSYDLRHKSCRCGLNEIDKFLQLSM